MYDQLIAWVVNSEAAAWESQPGGPVRPNVAVQPLCPLCLRISVEFDCILVASWVVFETTLSQCIAVYSSATTVLSVCLVKFLGKTEVKGQLL